MAAPRTSRCLVALAGCITTLGACTPAWTPSPDAAGTERYVSLGDSWVSGPFVGDQVGDPVDCGRSNENFPSLIARQLDVIAFADVSCGGADTDDLFNSSKANLGGRARPQLDALQPDTTLVTVGIGGNDAKISDLALKCINLLPIPLGPPPFGQPCVERLTKGGVDTISAKIETTRPNVEKALMEIERRSPRARVFVLGYGAPLADSGDGCWPRVPLLPPDVEFIRAKMQELNAMLRDVAERTGAYFVDLWTLTQGHDLCQPYGTAWMNAVALDPSGFPGHPNRLYHQNVAPIVVEQMLAEQMPVEQMPDAGSKRTS